MSVYKVDICGVTTSKLPVLKDDEKEELFEKIKKGDKAAREKYIRGIAYCSCGLENACQRLLQF